MQKEYVFTFLTTNDSIKSEILLINEKIKVKVMPLPSEIKAGCGLCLRVSEEEKEETLKILLESGIQLEGIFIRQWDKYNKSIYKKEKI